MAIAGRRHPSVPVIVRSTLQDPPVLTTPAPVVVAAQPDRRWLATRSPLVLSCPLVPVVVPATATPGPVVVTAAADRRRYAGGATVTRNPPAASTPPPVTSTGLLMAMGM